MKNFTLTLLLLIGFISIINAQSRTDTTDCYTFSSPTDSSFIGIQVKDYDENNNLLQGTAYSWDNGWVPNEKNEYTYDANNNNTLDIGYNWDGNINDWVGDKKEEYTYDSNNNKTSRIHTYWNSSTSSWSNSNNYEYTYDVNNNLILEIWIEWDFDSNDWRTDYKYEYSYDANNNQHLKLHYNWDSNINDWKVGSKYEYTYDLNNIVTLSLYYTWDSNANDWNISSEKREYTNDTENIINYINFDWDTDNSVWLTISKKEFAYDINNNLTLDADYNWDSNSNDWVGGMEKFEYTYDVFNNETVMIFSIWQSNNWFIYYKCYTNVDYSTTEVYIPDANFLAALVSHNPTIDVSGDGLIQVTEATGFTGVISVPSQNIVDLTGIEAFVNITGLDCSQNQIVELDLPNNIALESILCNDNVLTSLNVANGNNAGAKSLNAITITNENFHAENNPDLDCIQVDDANWSTANWTNVDAQSTFSADCTTATVSEIQISNLSVYPNPTKGQITIDGKDVEQVEIYNLSGVLIQSTNSKEIDLSQEAKGIYYVKVTTTNGVATQKLILE